MSTQSPDGVNPPTALAKLHLEDGSTLTGRSFGCHESMTGEVRTIDRYIYIYIYIYYITSTDIHLCVHIICNV